MSENIGHAELVNKLVDLIIVDSEPGGINNKALFQNVLQYSIGLNQPVQIAGLIGQGGKDHLGRSDVGLLDKYSRFSQRIEQYYPYGSEISLIGADVHGIANGIEDKGYLVLMQQESQVRGFYWLTLSDLYNRVGAGLPSREIVTLKSEDGNDIDYREWLFAVPREIRNTLKYSGKA